MSITHEELFHRLLKNGLMTEQEIETDRQMFLGQEVEQVAHELYRKERLTLYQSTALCEKESPLLTLGDYSIRGLIGKGGMGQVYRALHRTMNRVVAIKTLLPSVVHTKIMVQRFLREVTVAARLEHKNIVTAYDAGEHGGIYFLAMEYVDGPNLYELVGRNGPLPLEQAMDYVIQAGEGLDYAHAQGVVHRDIKPSNLLLDKKGTVKILDMGLAKVMTMDGRGEVFETEMTSTGQVLGTPAYLPPEQTIHRLNANHLSDMYSLGRTFQFLLVGPPKRHQEPDSQTQVINPVRLSPMLSDKEIEIPEELDKVFGKMVAPDPAERFSSMRDCLHALQSCRQTLESHPTWMGSEDSIRDALTIQMEKPPAPPRGKARLLAISGGILALALVAGLLLSQQPGSEANDNHLRSPGKVEVPALSEPGNQLTAGTEGSQPPAPPSGRPTFPTPEGAVSRIPPDSLQNELAQWVFARGGTINIITQGGPPLEEMKLERAVGRTSLHAMADLPHEGFRLWRISFAAQKDFDDQTFQELARKVGPHPTIANLNLGVTSITAKGMANLKPFEDSLEALAIYSTEAISEASIPYIARCSKLRLLFLAVPPGSEEFEPLGEISRNGIQTLQAALPDCHIIYREEPSRRATHWVLGREGKVLVHCDGKDVLITRDEEIPESPFSMVQVDLAGKKVLAELYNLRDVSGLRHFDLHGTDVTDADLRWLTGLHFLQELDVSSTGLTDRAVPYLKQLRSLRKLKAEETQISPDLLQELLKQIEENVARGPGTRPAPGEPSAAPVQLPEAFKIPAGDGDQYGNPVRQGLDPATQLPLEIEHALSGIHFVFVPPGQFQMGSPMGEIARSSSEEPIHSVQFDAPFYLGKYEVTQREWTTVTGTQPWLPSRKFVQVNDFNPANWVSWEECQVFVAKINTISEPMGKWRFSLPSEAQWEYGCRAMTATPFFFGRNMRDSGEYGWVMLGEKAAEHPQRVGLKSPNLWMLYDMMGNVAEWCADTWHESYEGAPANGNAWTEGGRAIESVGRGGAWLSGLRTIRSASRFHHTKRAKLGSMGLRLALQVFASSPE